MVQIFTKVATSLLFGSCFEVHILFLGLVEFRFDESSLSCFTFFPHISFFALSYNKTPMN
jgi:hypothetical protein